MALKRGSEVKLSDILVRQFDSLHKLNLFDDEEIEMFYLQNKINCLRNNNYGYNTATNFRVSPSSADNCLRELYYKAVKAKKDKEQEHYPYQKRWTRNSTAVHEAVQKDILYFEKYLKEPRLTIAYNDKGMPMWEENIKKNITLEYKGEFIDVTGMMDGILQDNETGELIGFEFKTKSNSVAQVGDYKLREPSEHHRIQCVLYSIMFNLDTFILMYESVVKDYWNSGADAKPDIKAFTIKVTEEDRQMLMEKYYKASLALKSGSIPDKDVNKCLFCNYKEACKGLEVHNGSM